MPTDQENGHLINPGAPGNITLNINTSKGIVNVAAITFDTLSFSDHVKHQERVKVANHQIDVAKSEKITDLDLYS